MTKIHYQSINHKSTQNISINHILFYRKTYFKVKFCTKMYRISLKIKFKILQRENIYMQLVQVKYMICPSKGKIENGKITCICSY